jgi:hypothetical protein
MTTRRDFLKSTALASAGIALSGIYTKTNAASYSRIVGANRKVNLAHIGIGNRGWEIINDFDKTGLANVVALCDVDMGAEHTQKAMAKFPNAKRFKDFREMFDKIGNEFEAVAIATPDFAHFPAVIDYPSIFLPLCYPSRRESMFMWRNLWAVHSMRLS